MSSDSLAALLPVVPSNLCFNKDQFKKDNFSVDSFVSECCSTVPLEVLRDDLSVYIRVLRSAMVELINKDYADFVNLSTNLVFLDKAISNLSNPLEQLKKQVREVSLIVGEILNALRAKMDKRRIIKKKKLQLLHLTSISESVTRLERLLGVADSQDSPGHREIKSHVVERAANELNQLEYHVTRSKGSTLADSMRPRVGAMRALLVQSVEGSFVDAVQCGSAASLSHCLRVVVIMDRVGETEQLYRTAVVRPHLDQVFSDYKLDRGGLQALYHKIIDFISAQTRILRPATDTSLSDDQCNFLVNSVWPEVADQLETNLPYLFSAGNSAVFHQNYSLTMEFIGSVEASCWSQASVHRLRSHPAFTNFMAKFNLPVYYHIKFQEIAGAFEVALKQPFTASQKDSGEPSSEFQLQASEVMWGCVTSCWRNDVFLPALTSKFWKLTLQLLQRYGQHVTDLISDLKSGGPTSNFNSDVTSTSNGVSEGRKDLEVRNLVNLIADTTIIINKSADIVDSFVRPLITETGFQQWTILTESLDEVRDSLSSLVPRLGETVVEQVSKACCGHLQAVTDIPRLYRKTNKETPTKPSGYISLVLKPVYGLKEQGLPDDLRRDLLRSVLTSTTSQFHAVTSDVLTSIKKMEDSLKRLKKARTTTSQVGLTDDDKIRLQLILDVESYSKQVENLEVDPTSLQVLQDLIELVESARPSPERAT